jgi:hypothetical protein
VSVRLGHLARLSQPRAKPDYVADNALAQRPHAGVVRPSEKKPRYGSLVNDGRKLPFMRKAWFYNR